MATSDRAQVLAAIAKYGPSVQALAEKRYGISGEALLAKLAQGESGAISDPTAARGKVSSAGAKAWTQFTAQSRREAITRYGIDPWASPDQAFHATSLHLRGKINGQTGLAGYNPGDPEYTDYILRQHVGDVRAAAGSAPRANSASGTTTASAAAPATTDPLGAAFDAGSSGSLSSLLAGAAQQAPAVASGSLPTPPSFAAAPPLPQGYQAPPSGGGPQPVAAADAQLPTTSDLSLPSVDQATTSASAGAVGGSAASGIQQTASAIVNHALARAGTLDARHLPYLWGGGHAGRVGDVSRTGPLDCSGAVSAVLGIDPRVSGQFERFGSAGKTTAKSGINVYANDTHVIMSIVVNGKERFFGTSHSNAGGGAGWIPASQLNADYLSRFTVRHLARADAKAG
jgi:hypothetical protein